MASVAASWKTIEAVLWEHAHSVFRALRPPATAAALGRLQTAFPGKLPRDVLQSLQRHDGLQNSHLDEIRFYDYWALLPISAILKEYRTLSQLPSAHDFAGGRFDADPRIRNDAHWRPGWLPLLDADGDKIVLDLDPGPQGRVGQVLKWSNCGGFPTRVSADSWQAWLADVAERLASRQFRPGESGGLWLNDEGRV